MHSPSEQMQLLKAKPSMNQIVVAALQQRQTTRFHLIHLVSFAFIFAQSGLAILSVPVFLRNVPCGDVNDCQLTFTCTYEISCQPHNRVLAQTTAFLGSFLSNIMFSLLGGRFGRKLALNAAFWTYLLGLLVLLNPSAGFSSLIAGLFLMGGVMCASSNFVFLMINEIFSERWRERSCAALMVIWSLSEMVIAPLINLLDGWENYYFWVLLLPSIATAFSLIFILDSPLFFLEQGSTHRAFQVLDMQPNHEDPDLRLKQRKAPTLFEKMNLRTLKKLAVCALLLFGLQIIYYGTQFAFQNVGYGPEVNNLVLGGFQLLGNLLCLLIIPVLPRRPALIVLYLLSIALTGSAGLVEAPWLLILLGGLARVSNSFCFTLKSIYIQELFQSSVRAESAGVILSMGLLGGSLVPGLLHIIQRIGLSEMTGVAVLALLCSPVLLLLQQTKLKAGCKQAKGLQ